MLPELGYSAVEDKGNTHLWSLIKQLIGIHDTTESIMLQILSKLTKDTEIVFFIKIDL
jgi:hypothetical protein